MYRDPISKQGSVNLGWLPHIQNTRMWLSGSWHCKTRS